MKAAVVVFMVIKLILIMMVMMMVVMVIPSPDHQNEKGTDKGGSGHVGGDYDQD